MFQNSWTFSLRRGSSSVLCSGLTLVEEDCQVLFLAIICYESCRHQFIDQFFPTPRRCVFQFGWFEYLDGALIIIAIANIVSMSNDEWFSGDVAHHHILCLSWMRLTVISRVWNCIKLKLWNLNTFLPLRQNSCSYGSWIHWTNLQILWTEVSLYQWSQRPWFHEWTNIVLSQRAWSIVIVSNLNSYFDSIFNCFLTLKIMFHSLLLAIDN